MTFEIAKDVPIAATVRSNSLVPYLCIDKNGLYLSSWPVSSLADSCVGTIGSETYLTDASDYFRFDDGDFFLKFFQLHIPERLGQVQVDLDDSTAQSNASIFLEHRVTGFQVRPPNRLSLFGEKSLLAVSDGVENNRVFMINVSERLSLAFCEGLYVGWLLKDYLSALSVDNDICSNLNPKPEDYDLLYKYFSIFTTEFFDFSEEKMGVDMRNFLLNLDEFNVSDMVYRAMKQRVSWLQEEFL